MRSLTSIIVPCWNQVELTRLCLRAVFRHTQRAFELLVIDNGSNDDTGMYLAGVHDVSIAPVTVISNDRNVGFPAAINQGLRMARGEYLVVLNNDVVVTDGWLEQLIALACSRGTTGRDGQTDPLKIGLVGPMSNYAAAPQVVGNVAYRDLDEMQEFALRWRNEHRGQWFTAEKLSGFCLLLKRAVYEAVGGLDERLGIGLFADEDVAVRARGAGFELALAHDLFIHRFGGRTFIGKRIDAGGILDENEAKFGEKLGDSALRGVPVALRPFSVDSLSQPEPAVGPQRAQISADGEDGEQSSGCGGEVGRAVNATPARGPRTPVLSRWESETCAATSSSWLHPPLRTSASSADQYLRPVSASPADHARVSLTMIVKDDGLRHDPDDAELLFRKALTHRVMGQPGEAEASWRRILGLRRPEQFSSVDMGIYGHLTLRNLAVLAEERGDRAETERLWRAVLAESPSDREALAHLADQSGVSIPG